MASVTRKKSAPAFNNEVVKALLSQHFTNPKTKFAKQAGEPAATFMQLFTKEAFNRAAKLAKKEAAGPVDDLDDNESHGFMSGIGASAGEHGALLAGGGTQPAVATVTPDHIRRILPALLLDF